MILIGDCLDSMKGMDADTVDSIVTDPPYGISFLGWNWDKGVPAAVYWKEALRVLKPEGYLLSFSGAKTHHLMATAIESGGFEVVGQKMWIYGQGFPKGVDIGRSLAKDGDHGLAAKWKGWSAALKPAHEPIVIAKNPQNKESKTLEGLSDFFYCPKPSTAERNLGCSKLKKKNMAGNDSLNFIRQKQTGFMTDAFYEEKLNYHPTVKPLSVMRHLVKAVTPSGGTVLDPFLGSGTTAMAAVLENLNYIGCELTEEYLPIINARVAWAQARSDRKLNGKVKWPLDGKGK